MLSKLQKVSKDLIIYSALVSEFERLDFKDDALAGVRANFFNSKGSPQVEKTEISLNGVMHSLTYSMKNGEPLSWKISSDRRPVQTVKRASDGGYSVMSYSASGVVFKRQYFNSAHEWLRTEYYDRELENRLAAVIYPKRVEKLVVLCLQRFKPSGISTADLYPSLTSPKRRCAALIYSNSGMLWYDSSFKPEEVKQEEPAAGDGFRFTREAFISANVRDVLKLKFAPYLSKDDISVPIEAPVQEEPVAYSAYDKIENILFEAHKTNKNIFGELAGHAMEESGGEDEAEPEQTEAIEKSEAVEQAEAVEQPEAEAVEEPAKEAPAASEETPVQAEQAESVDETAEQPETVDETAEQPEIIVAELPEADSVINTRQGEYSYYGKVDENGKRVGRGRTVTPDGLTAYEGYYVDDKREGFGVCYYKDGSANYIGGWNGGNRSGTGVGFRQSDGTMHAGKWNDNKPDGFGARFDKNGDFLDVCTYVDGKRNGKSVSFDEEGNVVIRLWKDGEQVSEHIVSD